MDVLIAGEFSGTIRDEFEKRGHNAMSCDLFPTENPGQHYQGDVRDIINDGWDMLIAHPMCTYIANSGVRWLHEEAERWPKLYRDAAFFKEMLDADVPLKCIENPIPHKYAIPLIGRKYDQIIQPWMFGHPEKKATCLWLEGLPKLKPTNIVKGEMERLTKKEQNRIHYMSPGSERGKLRSITFQGVAEAMVDQWGKQT
jgi:hypothetical protein